MKKLLLVLVAALPFTFMACGDNNEIDGPKKDSENLNQNIGSKGESVTRYEMPHLNSNYDYICHTTADGTVNYTMEYDKANLQPRWVAYTYDSKTAQKNISFRTEAWAPEPFYNNQKQYQVDVQMFQGYNRGHIVGSAERYYSTEANEQTFYMSNMSPMNGQFNSEYWGYVEDMVRDDWGRKVNDSKSTYYKGTLYVVKGGTIDPNNKRFINVRNTLGDNVKMAVPNYFWMACLYVSESGNARAIGFWMEHKDYKDTSESNLQKLRRESVRTIDQLEQLTGIDFFCNLSDNIENLVESKSESSSWGFN